MDGHAALDRAIRKRIDFPKKGILYYDITGVLMNAAVFRYCLDQMVEFYRDEHVTAVAAIE